MSCSGTTYGRLGDYIREVDVRNSTLEVKLSQGICNQKFFQNPRQVSATPHLDKIVRTGQFAYNRATTRNGNKISIAYREGPDCTVSSAYCVFYITNEEVINPYYLWLWFMRPDFDRYAIFKSHGSAHDFFEYETLCDTYVPLPPIEEQRRIVREYHDIQNRIKTNERTITKLEEAAKAIYRKMFVDDIDPENLPDGWRMGRLGDIAVISSGTSCRSKQDKYSPKYCYPVAGAAGIIGWSDTYNQDSPIMTTGRVGTLGVVNRYYEKIWTSDNVLILKSSYPEYCFQILKAVNFYDIVKGGVQSLITQSDLKSTTILIPNTDALSSFEVLATTLQSQIQLIRAENSLLKKTLEIVLNSIQ